MNGRKRAMTPEERERKLRIIRAMAMVAAAQAGRWFVINCTVGAYTVAKLLASLILPRAHHGKVSLHLWRREPELLSL